MFSTLMLYLGLVEKNVTILGSEIKADKQLKSSEIISEGSQVKSFKLLDSDHLILGVKPIEDYEFFKQRYKTLEI
jgi:hypothetical protein